MTRMVTTYYLEMLDPGQFRPKEIDDPKFRIVRVNQPAPHLNKFLYEQVGADWAWVDRLSWTDEQWHAYVHAPNVHTYVAYYDGTPAGYYELKEQPDGQVEIAYFGLLPAFIGRGLGGPLLSSAIANAWRLGARRVWVHTCTLDHPHALNNYLRRGFTVYNQETMPIE